MSAIQFAEKGLLPDFLIRYGIRRLCKQRLKDEKACDVEQYASRKNAVIQQLRESPIAIETDAANRQHYEVPAEFYLNSLGKNLKYSGCFWPESANGLDEAEDKMLALYAKRGQFEDGQNILELGCGWGSITLYLASRFPKSKITGVSNSNSQREHIMGRAKARGLDNVNIITCDVNELSLENKFDRVISIEMFEHVRNYQFLLNKVSSWMSDEGKLFIHIFCHKDVVYPFEVEGEDNWMGRYFFTGGLMPSTDTLLHFQDKLSIERQWLVNGQHYEKTANAWLDNADKNKQNIMPVFEKTYGKDAEIWFQRWRIFFMSCAELFGYKQGNEWMVAHYLFAKK